MIERKLSGRKVSTVVLDDIENTPWHRIQRGEKNWMSCVMRANDFVQCGNIKGSYKTAVRFEELPEKMQEKLTLLMMCDGPFPARPIESIGQRVQHDIYHVEFPFGEFVSATKSVREARKAKSRRHSKRS